MVNHAIQQPLAVDFPFPTQREAVKPFAIPYVRKYRLHYLYPVSVFVPTLYRFKLFPHLPA
jgi:hypothetical protein